MLNCPKCKEQISELDIRQYPWAFTCKNCGAKLVSKTSSFGYLGFRIFAGGFAVWVASPFKECGICNWGVIFIVVIILAFFLVKHLTRIELFDSNKHLDDGK